MNDEEAIKGLQGLLLYGPLKLVEPVLRHALLAIADRAELVEACEATAAMGCPACVDVARRHMRGKE